MSVKLVFVDYSSTGTVQTMAERLNVAAEAAGAEIRLRHMARRVVSVAGRLQA